MNRSISIFLIIRFLLMLKTLRQTWADNSLIITGDHDPGVLPVNGAYLHLTQEIGDLLGRDFYARELAVTESIVCLPAGHPLASRKQVKIAELKNETFVSGTEDRVPGYRRRLAQICRNCGSFRPTLIDNSGDLSGKLAMVANEDAVALLPAYMRHQASPGVRCSTKSLTSRRSERTFHWPDARRVSRLL